jgi:hypothetical protein
MKTFIPSLLVLFLTLLSQALGDPVPGWWPKSHKGGNHCLSDGESDGIIQRWLSIFNAVDPAVVDKTVTDDITVTDNLINFIFFPNFHLLVSCVSLHGDLLSMHCVLRYLIYCLHNSGHH